MRKILSTATSVLILTTMLYGCVPNNRLSSTSTSATPVKTAVSFSDDMAAVTPAGAFDGYYIAQPVDVLEEDWLTKFAGGREKTIPFKLGQWIPNNNKDYAEVSIELEGKDSKLTLVANGGHYEYDDSSQQLKKATIDFLTGKKLVGEEIIKDYSDGKQKIVLLIDFNENGTAVPSVMFCPQGDDEVMPMNNYYKVEVKD